MGTSLGHKVLSIVRKDAYRRQSSTHKRKETNPQCFTTGMPPKTLYPPMDSTKISEFDHKYPIDAYANFLPESRKFG